MPATLIMIFYFFKNSEKCIHPALAIEEDDQPQDLKAKSELEVCFIYKKRIAWAWFFWNNIFLHYIFECYKCQMPVDFPTRILVEWWKNSDATYQFQLFWSEFCRWHQNSLQEFLQNFSRILVGEACGWREVQICINLKKNLHVHELIFFAWNVFCIMEQSYSEVANLQYENTNANS